MGFEVWLANSSHGESPPPPPPSCSFACGRLAASTPEHAGRSCRTHRTVLMETYDDVVVFGGVVVQDCTYFALQFSHKHTHTHTNTATHRAFPDALPPPLIRLAGIDLNPIAIPSSSTRLSAPCRRVPLDMPPPPAQTDARVKIQYKL